MRIPPTISHRCATLSFRAQSRNLFPKPSIAESTFVPVGSTYTYAYDTANQMEALPPHPFDILAIYALYQSR